MAGHNLQSREKGGQSYDDVERVRNLSPPQTLPPKPYAPTETVNQLTSDFVENKFSGQPLTSGSPEDIWLTQGYNRKFSITDLRNKITGLNQLSKFYFDFPEIRNNRFVRNEGEESKIAEWVNESPEILENIYFYSENVTIPMRGINTDPHTYANGFRFESPVSSNYGDGDIAITMIVDHKYKIYDFFMNWMNSIHDKTTGYFSFHNRYTTDLDIYQLNNIGVEFSKDNTFDSMIADRSKRFFNYRVHLGNCYPKSVSAIEFKHESRDERVKITVNFTYEQVYYNRDFN